MASPSPDFSTFFINDIYITIIDFCSFSDGVKLALTCKHLYKMFMECVSNRWPKLRSGYFNLKPFQYRVKELFTENREISLTVNAPMGFGKTAMGLSLALDGWIKDESRGVDRLPWLILVPPKAISTWIAEAKKMFGNEIFNPKAKTSPLLVPHSIHSPLQCSEASKNLGNPPHYEVYAILMSTSQIWDKSARYEGIILDEAHTAMKKKWFTKMKTVKTGKRLYLTAANCLCMTNEENSPGIPHRLKAGNDIIKSKLPTLVSHIVDMKGERVFSNEAPSERDIDLYVCMEQILEIIGDKKGRTTVFFPNVHTNSRNTDMQKKSSKKSKSEDPKCIATEKLFENNIKKIMEEKGKKDRVFIHKNATSVIESFEETENGILFISHNWSESININCERAIILRGDWVNKERFRQIIGRVFRPTNTNKYVDVYHLVPTGLPRLKTIYMDSFIKSEIDMSNDAINIDLLLSSFRLVSLLDPSFEHTSCYDIVAMCNQDLVWKPEEMLEWWKKKKGYYTDEEKKKFLEFPLIERVLKN